MSLSSYWLMPPGWTSCAREDIPGVLAHAFPSSAPGADAQERDPARASSPSGGEVIALATGPADATYGFTPTIMVLASPIPAETLPAQALADSARALTERVPGFRMLEDCDWPLAPESSHLRTGIYILGTTPITACQWAWTQADGEDDFLVTATATTTTPAFGILHEQILAIITSLEVTRD